METLRWAISGEFVTNMVRDRYYIEDSLTYDEAINILLACLVTDQISLEERTKIAEDILSGRSKIVGTSGSDDYGVEKSTEDEIASFSDRIFMTSPSAYAKYKKLNPDMFVSQTIVDNTGMFAEFNPSKVTKDSDDPFQLGWLAPNGTFYLVDFGEHSAWAYDYIRKDKNLYSEYQRRLDSCSTATKIIETAADLLVSTGWILIDSPGLDYPHITKSDTRDMTKAQREFLFDYYIKNKMPGEARKLYQ